jgi:hypothetical protein
MRKVGMKEPTRMPLSILVLMNVQKRRLHEGKRQRQVHKDGDTGTHTLIVPFQAQESSGGAADGPLKLEFQVELHPSWRLGGHRTAIKGRADYSHIRDIIFVIQNVERVDCQRRSGSPLSRIVVRDPRDHPDAIIPDLSTNKVSKFTKEQVALVYGSIWKQRYFTKIRDDYYPLPAQWDVANKTWRPYHVADSGADWWTAFYPSDNMQRPTGPTCDGCHSVSYDIHTRQVTEWNVGCERCHGPGQRTCRPSHSRQYP